MKFIPLFLSIALFFGGSAASPAESIQIKPFAKAGFLPVICYLLYDARTKDAAVIDAGGAIEPLLAEMKQSGLKLRYIFITHCHPDHVDGIPAIRDRYPEAKVCLTKEEYEDQKQMSRWREIFAPALVEAWGKIPDMAKLMDFDYSRIGAPDIFLEDRQKLAVGGATITVLKTPGHSRGSLTFVVDQALFPGDLILYHATGDLDYPLCSRDEIVKSIRLLYGLFPDDTPIYPGHGPSSTIGFEKTGNRNVTADKIIWE